MILSGRRVNDGMGAYLAQRVVKLIAASGRPIIKARVGILGFTFKENVPDIRNSKVVDTYRELREFGIEPIVHDARADPATVRHEYGIELAPLEEFRELVRSSTQSDMMNIARFRAALGDMIGKRRHNRRRPLAARSGRRFAPTCVYWSL